MITLKDIAAGGFTRIRTHEVKLSAHDKRARDRKVEIFRREADQTYWRVDSSKTPNDVHIMEVAPKIQREKHHVANANKAKEADPDVYIDTIVYHEK